MIKREHQERERKHQEREREREKRQENPSKALEKQRALSKFKQLLEVDSICRSRYRERKHLRIFRVMFNLERSKLLKKRSYFF